MNEKEKVIFDEKIPMLGTLYIDYVFLEHGFLILFLTTDSYNNKYLTVCSKFNIESIYFVSKVTNEELINFVKNKISINQMFTKNEQIYKIVLENHKTDCTLEEVANIDKLYLPEQNVFLDFDLDEIKDFNKYLTKNKNSI